MPQYQDTVIQCDLNTFKGLPSEANTTYKNCVFYVKDVDTDTGLVNAVLNSPPQFVDCYVHYVGRSGDSGKMSYTGLGSVDVDNTGRTIGLKLDGSLKEDVDGKLGINFDFSGGVSSQNGHVKLDIDDTSALLLGDKGLKLRYRRGALDIPQGTGTLSVKAFDDSLAETQYDESNPTNNYGLKVNPDLKRGLTTTGNGLGINLAQTAGIGSGLEFDPQTEDQSALKVKTSHGIKVEGGDVQIKLKANVGLKTDDELETVIDNTNLGTGTTNAATDTGKNPTNTEPITLKNLNGTYSDTIVDNSMEYKSGKLAATRQNPMETIKLGPGLSKSVQDRKLYLNLNGIVTTGDDEKLTVNSYGGLETTVTGLHVNLPDNSGLDESNGLKISLGDKPGLTTQGGLSILPIKSGNNNVSGLDLSNSGVKVNLNLDQFNINSGTNQITLNTSTKQPFKFDKQSGEETKTLTLKIQSATHLDIQQGELTSRIDTDVFDQTTGMLQLKIDSPFNTTNQKLGLNTVFNIAKTTDINSSDYLIPPTKEGDVFLPIKSNSGFKLDNKSVALNLDNTTITLNNGVVTVPDVNPMIWLSQEDGIFDNGLYWGTAKGYDNVQHKLLKLVLANSSGLHFANSSLKRNDETTVVQGLRVNVSGPLAINDSNQLALITGNGLTQTQTENGVEVNKLALNTTAPFKFTDGVLDISVAKPLNVSSELGLLFDTDSLKLDSNNLAVKTIGANSGLDKAEAKKGDLSGLFVKTDNTTITRDENGIHAVAQNPISYLQGQTLYGPGLTIRDRSTDDTTKIIDTALATNSGLSKDGGLAVVAGKGISVGADVAVKAAKPLTAEDGTLKLTLSGPLQGGDSLSLNYDKGAFEETTVEGKQRFDLKASHGIIVSAGVKVNPDTAGPITVGENGVNLRTGNGLTLSGNTNEKALTLNIASHLDTGTGKLKLLTGDGLTTGGDKLDLVLDSNTIEINASKQLAAKTVIQNTDTISVQNGDSPSVKCAAGIKSTNQGVAVDTGLTTKTVNSHLEVNPAGFMSSSIYVNDGNGLSVKPYDDSIQMFELGLDGDYVKRDCFVAGNYVVFAGGKTEDTQYGRDLEVYYCAADGKLTRVQQYDTTALVLGRIGNVGTYYDGKLVVSAGTLTGSTTVKTSFYKMENGVLEKIRDEDTRYMQLQDKYGLGEDGRVYNLNGGTTIGPTGVKSFTLKGTSLWVQTDTEVKQIYNSATLSREYAAGDQLITLNNGVYILKAGHLINMANGSFTLPSYDLWSQTDTTLYLYKNDGTVKTWTNGAVDKIFNIDPDAASFAVPRQGIIVATYGRIIKSYDTTGKLLHICGDKFGVGVKTGDGLQTTANGVEVKLAPYTGLRHTADGMDIAASVAGAGLQFNAGSKIGTTTTPSTLSVKLGTGLEFDDKYNIAINAENFAGAYLTEESTGKLGVRADVNTILRGVGGQLTVPVSTFTRDNGTTTNDVFTHDDTNFYINTAFLTGLGIKQNTNDTNSKVGTTQYKPLMVNLKANGGLQFSGESIEVKPADFIGNGLQAGTKISVKTDGSTISSSADGIKVVLPAQNNLLEEKGGVMLYNCDWYASSAHTTPYKAWVETGAGHFIPNFDMYLGPGLKRGGSIWVQGNTTDNVTSYDAVEQIAVDLKDKGGLVQNGGISVDVDDKSIYLADGKVRVKSGAVVAGNGINAVSYSEGVHTVSVKQGNGITVNANGVHVATDGTSITKGTSIYLASSAITGSNGITATRNSTNHTFALEANLATKSGLVKDSGLAVDVDNKGIEVNSDGKVQIKDGAILGSNGINVGYDKGVHTVSASVDGTTIEANTQLKVKATGLQGNGLQTTDNKLAIKSNDAALSVSSAGLKLETTPGQFSHNKLQFQPESIAGSGLVVENGILNPRIGNGLEIKGMGLDQDVDSNTATFSFQRGGYDYVGVFTHTLRQVFRLGEDKKFYEVWRETDAQPADAGSVYTACALDDYIVAGVKVGGHLVVYAWKFDDGAFIGKSKQQTTTYANIYCQFVQYTGNQFISVRQNGNAIYANKGQIESGSITISNSVTVRSNANANYSANFSVVRGTNNLWVVGGMDDSGVKTEVSCIDMSNMHVSQWQSLSTACQNPRLYPLGNDAGFVAINGKDFSGNEIGKLQLVTATEAKEVSCVANAAVFVSGNAIYMKSANVGFSYTMSLGSTTIPSTGGILTMAQINAGNYVVALGNRQISYITPSWGVITESGEGINLKSADTVLNVGADGLSLLTTTGLGRDDDGKLTIQPEALSGPGIKAENGHLALDVGNGLTVERRGLRTTNTVNASGKPLGALWTTKRDGIEYIGFFADSCQQVFRRNSTEIQEVWYRNEDWGTVYSYDAAVIGDSVYIAIGTDRSSQRGEYILKYTFGKGGFLKKEKDVAIKNDSATSYPYTKLVVYEGSLFLVYIGITNAPLYIREVNPDTLTGIENWVQIRLNDTYNAYPNTIVHNNYLYIVGGLKSDSGSYVASTSISRVDLSGTLSSSSIENSWVTLNSGVNVPVLCVHDGYLFVYGGYDYNNNPLTKLQAVKLDDGTVLAEVETNIMCGCMWVYQNQVFIHGKRTNGGTKDGQTYKINNGAITTGSATATSANIGSMKYQILAEDGECVVLYRNSHYLNKYFGSFKIQYTSDTTLNGVKVKNGDSSILVNSSGVSVNKATNSGLEITTGQTTNGLAVKAADQSLSVDSNGVKVHCATNGGLQTIAEDGNTQGLNVKANTKGALKVNSDGVDLDQEAAGNGLTYTAGTSTTTKNRTRLSVKAADQSLSVGSSGVKVHCATNGGLTTVDDSGNTQGLNVKLPTNSGLTADSNGLKVNTSVIQSKLTAGEGINLESNTVSVAGDNTLVSHKMKLSAARWNVVATTFMAEGKEYAVFAGGQNGDVNSSSDNNKILGTVDVFTVDGQSTLTTGSRWVESTAVTLGDMALFGGGTYGYKDGSEHIFRVYNSDGVLVSNYSTNFTGRHHFAAAVAGDYAFFAGGTNDGDSATVNTVDVYKVGSSHTLTKQTSSLTLDTRRSHLCGATLTTKDGVQYAVFAGGETTVKSDGAIDTPSKIVDVFKSDGTKYDGAKVEELYNQRTRGTMTPLEDTVLYAGGWNSKTYGKVCKIYLEDGVFKNTFTDDILQPRMDLASTTVGKYAFFAGGWNGTTYYDTVDVVHLVDGTPTLYKTLTLDTPAAFLAGTRLGSLAIFGGGKNSNGAVDTITAFRVVGDIVEKVDLNKLALNIAQNSGLSLENGMGVNVDGKSVEVNTEGKIRVKSGAVVPGPGMKTDYASGIHTVSVDLVTNGGLQTHTDADEDKGKLEVKLNPYGAVRADGNGLDIKSTIAGSGLEFTQGSSSANTQLGVKTSKLFKRAAFNLTPINSYSTLVYAGGYIYVFTPTVSYYAKYIGSVPTNAFTQLSSFQTFNTSTSYTKLQYIRAFSYDKYIWVAGMTGSTTFSILVYRINSGGSLTKCKKLDKTVNSTDTCFAGTIYKGKLLYSLNTAYKLVDCGGNETGFTSGTMFNHVCVFRIGDDVFGVSTGSSNQIVNILDTSKSCQAGSENIVFAGAARDTEDNAIVVVNSSSKFIMGYVKNQNGTPVWFAIKNATGSYPHKRQTVGKHGNYLLTNINDSLYMCYPDGDSEESYSTGTQFWDFICVPFGIISLGTGYVYYYMPSHTYIISDAVQDTNINPELTPGDGLSIAPDNTIKIKHGLTLTRGETLEVNKDMFKPRAGYGLERKLMIGRDPQYAATVQCRDFVFVFYRNAGKAEVYTLDWDFVREVDIPVFVADGTAPLFNSCVQAVSYEETIWVCGAISSSNNKIYTYHVEDDGTLAEINQFSLTGSYSSNRRKINLVGGVCYMSWNTSTYYYIFDRSGDYTSSTTGNECSTWFQIGSTTYWCGHTASTSVNIYKSSGIIATLGKGIAAASVVKCDESSVIILGWDYSSLSLWWFDSAPSLGARTDISFAFTEGEDIPSVHKVGNYVYVVVKGHVYIYTFDPSAHTFSKSAEINLDGIYGNSAITLGDRVYYFKGREIRYILGTAPAPYVDSGDMLCVKAGNGITSDVDGLKVNYGSTLEIPSSGTDKDKLGVKLKSKGGIVNDSGLKVDVDGTTITVNSSGKLVGTQQLSGGAGIDLTNNKLKIDLADNCGLKLGTGSGTPGDTDKLSIKLPTTNPGLKTTADGLDVKLNPNGGLQTSSTGLGVKPADNSLVLSSSGLYVQKQDYGALTVDTDGLGVKRDNTLVAGNSINNQLGSARVSPAAATVADKYALFAGGSASADIDVFYIENGTIKRAINMASLSTKRFHFVGITFKGFAIFAGGFTSDVGSPASSAIDVYGLDSSGALTQISQTETLTARYNLAAAVAGDRVYFAGGTSNGTAGLDTVEAFTISSDGVLSKVSGTFKLSAARHNLSGATLKSGGKEYAVFIGGESNGDVTGRIDAFAENGTRYTEILGRTETMRLGAAVSLGDRVLCGGGAVADRSGLPYMYQIKFNNGLVVSNVDSLSAGRRLLSGMNMGTYAFFGGGVNNASNYRDAVDVFTLQNDTVKRVKTLTLNAEVSSLACTHLGSFAIFAGGVNANGSSNQVSVFRVVGDDVVKVEDNTLGINFAYNSGLDTSNGLKVNVDGSTIKINENGQLQGSQQLSAGSGINLASNTVSVKADGTSLSVGSTGVKVNCATNGGLTVNSGLKVDLNSLVDNVSVVVNGNGKLALNSVVFV